MEDIRKNTTAKSHLGNAQGQMKETMTSFIAAARASVNGTKRTP